MADSTPSDRPTTVVIQAPSTTRRFTTWLGWMGFLLCGMLLVKNYATLHDYFDRSGGIQEKYVSGEKYGREKIAVINITGLITDGDGFVKRQIERIREDDQVKAVVVRVNSPGGTVTGSDYIYHHLTQLREERDLPLVVSMGGMATSGGYYVSMAVGEQEKSIFAEPTSTTGSIGVIIPHYDISGLLERFDIKDDSIATHPRKQMLSMTRPASDEERELLAAYIGESFQRFKAVIYSGRPELRAEEFKLEHEGRDLATGEVFTARQAKKFGLIDEVGFLEEAVERAAELAGIDAEGARVVQYERLATLFKIPGLAAATQGGTPGLAQSLLELGTPRAYYLCTSLPLLARSDPQAN